ncbi:MAG: tRNA pseudouridine(38-40) synthase TruA [Bdellovibrionales bacterium]
MGPKLKLLLTYDGTGFSGWQKQKQSQKPTVQGTLEQLISRLFDQPVRVIGASRTDAGVHALGQVAHFQAPVGLEKYNILRSLNAMAPETLAVKAAWQASEDFHALASSTGKTYRYLIHNSPLQSPLRRERTLWVNRPLDLDYLNRATAQILGQHDFKSFQSAGSEVLTTVREVFKAQWTRKSSKTIQFEIQGSGFLKQMVRNIVGTALDLHFSGEPPEMMKEILKAQDRRKALGTAAAQGLYLVRVHYPRDLDIRCRKL